MTDRKKEVEKYLEKKKSREYLIDTVARLFGFASYIICIVCCVLILFYQIANPHLTQTEITLYALSKYWWIIPLCIILALINSK